MNNHLKKLFPIQFQNEQIDLIVVDFDTTLIRENTLIQWVLFLLLKSDLTSKRKFFLLLNSFYRGLVSMLFSLFPSMAERAVRIAYKTFEEVEVKTVYDLVSNKLQWKGGYAINLNTKLLKVLQAIMDYSKTNTASKSKIVIYSQGSFMLAIKAFLQRKDVISQLKKAGIWIDRSNKTSIIANNLEIMNDRFTGKLISPILTKYNRLKMLPENSIFIGDNKDEAALRRMGENTVKFLNWKRIPAG